MVDSPDRPERREPSGERVSWPFGRVKNQRALAAFKAGEWLSYRVISGHRKSVILVIIVAGRHLGTIHIGMSLSISAGEPAPCRHENRRNRRPATKKALSKSEYRPIEMRPAIIWRSREVKS